MQAFPELYFARFVVLVEGDSEQVILPRLAGARKVDIDPSFVAIVPLGGRHVHHFWRLLTDLEIPYATLLDLDLGRSGGGWGRIKTICEQLIERGVDRDAVLNTTAGPLSDQDFEKMHHSDPSDLVTLKKWIEHLETYNVFFSWPLDIDMAMLAAFPSAYQAAVGTGRGPIGNADDAAKAVFGSGGVGLDLYTHNDLSTFVDLLPLYRYHFLTRSKPATHLAALVNVGDDDLLQSTPEPLPELIQRISSAT